MSETDLTESECPNCHTPLKGQFCSRCGQNQKGFDRFFLSLVRESFDDIFATDSRAAKTIVALLLRPGFLTREYFLGKRARYVQPLRLYFITSLAFFLLLSLVSMLNTDSIQLHMDDFDDEDKAVLEAVKEESASEGVHFEIDFLTEEQDKKLEAIFDTQIQKAKDIAENDPGRIIDIILDLAPPVVFCLLPLFAFLLKIVYINTDRYYTQHLVLAVHNHCFLYIVFMVDTFLDLFTGYLIVEAIQTVLAIWIPVYLILSLRANYSEGWILTLLKGGILAFSYIILFFFASLIAMVVGLMGL